MTILTIEADRNRRLRLDTEKRPAFSIEGLVIWSKCCGFRFYNDQCASQIGICLPYQSVKRLNMNR
jgi:hypothetical protein